jgi:Glycosyl hydrolase catalytic core
MKLRRAPVIAISLLSVLLNAATGLAQNYSYGMNTHQLGNSPNPFADNAQSLGVGFVRLDFDWESIEGNCKGCFNWGPTDDWVNQANGRGLQIFATLAYTPCWANGCAGRNHAPSNFQDWRDFVSAVVTHYSNTGVCCVNYFGMWNEPNDTQFWADGPSVFSLIVSQGYGAAKGANPSALVVGPDLGEGGVTGGWYSSMFCQSDGGLAKWLDVISVHWYNSSGVGIGDFMDSYVRPCSSGRPIWMTEGGANACAGDSNSEGQQNAYYDALMVGYQPRRSWWTKVFPYVLWDGSDCSNALISANWLYRKAAFSLYQNWITNFP